MMNNKEFNIDALLKPISEEQPSGRNIEYEMMYENIRQAGESDPDFLPQDEWMREPRKADWLKVASQSKEVLLHHSKDLQVTCWLVEAWIQLYQSAGLSAGLDLLNQMVIKWWHYCWPALDEYGADHRRGILNRLDRSISLYLTLNPLMGDEQSALAHWQKVLSYEHHSLSNSNAAAAEDYSMATFNQWANQLDPARITVVIEQLKGCKQHIRRFDDHYSAQTGDNDGCFFQQTEEVLGDLLGFYTRINERCNVQQDEIMLLSVLDPDAPLSAGRTSSAGTSSQQAMSRDLAITQMLTIAHFFRQTEPSSPVPMLMERAARWANMALSDWLQEMVTDERSLQEINLVLNGPAR